MTSMILMTMEERGSLRRRLRYSRLVDPLVEHQTLYSLTAADSAILAAAMHSLPTVNSFSPKMICSRFLVARGTYTRTEDERQDPRSC